MEGEKLNGGLVEDLNGGFYAHLILLWSEMWFRIPQPWQQLTNMKSEDLDKPIDLLQGYAGPLSNHL